MPCIVESSLKKKIETGAMDEAGIACLASLPWCDFLSDWVFRFALIVATWSTLCDESKVSQSVSVQQWIILNQGSKLTNIWGSQAWTTDADDDQRKEERSLKDVKAAKQVSVESKHLWNFV